MLSYWPMPPLYIALPPKLLASFSTTLRTALMLSYWPMHPLYVALIPNTWLRFLQVWEHQLSNNNPLKASRIFPLSSDHQPLSCHVWPSSSWCLWHHPCHWHHLLMCACKAWSSKLLSLKRAVYQASALFMSGVRTSVCQHARFCRLFSCPDWKTSNIIGANFGWSLVSCQEFTPHCLARTSFLTFMPHSSWHFAATLNLWSPGVVYQVSISFRSN